MSDLLVINEMLQNKMDVRSTTTITECKTVKQGGIISFGIDKGTTALMCQSMMGVGKKYVAVCYIIEAEEFFKIKNQK